MSPRLKTGLGFLVALVAAIWLTTRMPVAPVAPQGAAPPKSPTVETPGGATGAPGSVAGPRRPSPTRNASGRKYGSDIGFRTYDLLAEHYRKHGREFPGASLEDYLRLAQAVRDEPASDHVIEVVRADGVVTRFDRQFGVFIAFDSNGTIRTFFRPSDGEAYFRRQVTRGAR